ncbi:mechanosensitive ion channel family protein [Rufibacter roseus]|uniref:Mechanosensitive ion channel domain-containing protein n=1 Tax=Rufibacter roseus TaxID=1567108 RepID=A0ABW2DMB2_9BACT|nr:mechanosensitive ion channel family protein [Rufibacter roseus]
MRNLYFFLRLPLQRLLLLCCLLIQGSVAFAQEAAPSDSLTNQRLAETTQLLQQKEQQRVLDSLRKQELMQEIEQLKSSEVGKRNELEQKYLQMVTQDSLRNAERAKRIEALKVNAQGFPVAPFGDTLFMVYTKVGTATVQDRAEAINRRLVKLYNTNLYSSDSLHVYNGDYQSEVQYGEMTVMAITDIDALWFGTDRKTLAQQYLQQMQKAIAVEKEKNSLKNILLEIGLALLVLAGLFVIIFLINKLFRYLKLFIYTKRDLYFSGLKLKDYQLLDRQKQIGFVVFVLNLLRIFLLLLTFYLALPLLFSIFPQTQGWADTLISWVLSPATRIIRNIIGYLPNLFTILVIFLFTRYAVKLVHFFALEVDQAKLNISGFHRDWAMPTFNIVRFLLYVFMFIVIFPYLPGSNSPIFQGVSVFLGILFSLGSSSAISNMVAGLVITYMRPFKVGDRVKIGEIVGDVVEKNMLVTRIRTIKNEDITVPNSSVLSGHTVNYSTSSQDLGLILSTTVTIGYDVPWKQVHQLLIDAALATDGILKDKPPFVLQTSLEDFYPAYQLNAYTDQPNRQAKIYSNLHQNIQDKFNEGGVEILSPHYRAVRDGNQVTTPIDYLPTDYEAPAFRVSHPDQPKPTPQ